jgi:CheY-like chemotaxis protein
MANILIVDDEEGDQLGLAAMLEGAGHRVIAAASGHDALRLYLEHPIHVVVTDIVMPEGDGLDLISRLRSIKPDAAIIAVSGKGRSGLSAARSIGANQVFEKPVAPEELVQAVATVLGMSRTR